MRTIRILLLSIAIPLFAAPVASAAPSQAAGVPAPVDLRAYADRNGWDYRWDPIGKIAVLSGPRGQARFWVGSDSYIFQNSLRRLDQKTFFKAGSVFVPASVEGVIHPEPPVAAKTFSGSPTANQIRRVLLDAGHGGYDLGASWADELREKDIVLEISGKVAALLGQEGLEVISSRARDNFLSLEERTRLGNKKQADLFISIHANAAPTRSLKGFEVYYLSEATDDQALAVERAENSVLRLEAVSQQPSSAAVRTIVWDLREADNRRQSLRLAQDLVQSVGSNVTVAKDRIRSANFHVLRQSECPSVLIEVGYLTNRQDRNRLTNPAYRDALARAIASGILKYKNDYDRTDGFAS